jgi:hypothetical protein
MAETVKNGSRIAVEWMWRILAVIAVPIMAYLAMSINKLDATVTALQVSVAEIRGNRFTSGDGLEVWQSVADIRSKDAEHTVEIEELKRRMDRCEDIITESP